MRFTSFMRTASRPLMMLLLTASATVSAGELEERLTEARERLDEAASHLAEIYAEAYADEASSHKSDRAMLGVLLDECCTTDGVELSGVTPGGGADQAGLEAGDVLVQVGEEKLTGKTKTPFEKLTRFMKSVSPGDVVRVVYERDDEKYEVAITTQAHSRQTMRMLKEKVSQIGHDMGTVHTRVYAPDPPAVPGSVALVDVAGDLADYFGVSEGVLVLQEPKRSRVKAGDILLSVDGDEPKDAHHAQKMLAKADEPVGVAVLRKGKRQALTVQPGEFDAKHSSMRVIRIDRSKP